MVIYRLSGRANASTLPSNGDFSTLSDVALRSGAYHAATEIVLAVNHGVTSLDDPVDGNISSVDLGNGVTGRLFMPNNGLGPLRVEWLVGDTAYRLLSARGKTSSGPSGPVSEDLVKMAANTTVITKGSALTTLL